MADNKMGGFDTHIKTEEDVPTVTRKKGKSEDDRQTQ